MGCCFTCFTKKSHHNKYNTKSLIQQPLLNDNKRNSDSRGVSLQQEGYYESPVFQSSSSYENNDKSLHMEIHTDHRSRHINGESLIETPTLSELRKTGWLMKRGHMVRNWKKRYIVLDDGEIKYYDKLDESTGSGINMKGQVHLLGATYELKLTMEDTPVLEIIGRHGEKDLLLKFDSLKDAHEWYDAIHWTVYTWSVNSITSGEETVDTENWYKQQLVTVETSFQELSKGCKFNKHGFSSTGNMVTSLCSVQGNRDDVCLSWCSISQGNSTTSKGKKSQMRIIPLSDVVDVIYGNYSGDDIPMLSIVTKGHSLDLQIIDDDVANAWMKALADVLMFYSIPVPRRCMNVAPPEDSNNKMKRKAAMKANCKGSTFS